MKTTTETVTWCEDRELDKLIQETYDVTYTILGSEDLGPQDARMVYQVSKARPDEWDREELEKWKAGRDTYGNELGMILNDLCRRGLIEPGIVLMHAEY